MRIEAINISNKKVDLSTLNVIVGANGVGKTTLLSELYNSFASNSMPKKWKNITPEFDSSRWS